MVYLCVWNFIESTTYEIGKMRQKVSFPTDGVFFRDEFSFYGGDGNVLGGGMLFCCIVMCAI